MDKKKKDRDTENVRKFVRWVQETAREGEKASDQQLFGITFGLVGAAGIISVYFWIPALIFIGLSAYRIILQDRRSFDELTELEQWKVIIKEKESVTTNPNLSDSQKLHEYARLDAMLTFTNVDFSVDESRVDKIISTDEEARVEKVKEAHTPLELSSGLEATNSIESVKAKGRRKVVLGD